MTRADKQRQRRKRAKAMGGIVAALRKWCKMPEHKVRSAADAWYSVVGDRPDPGAVVDRMLGDTARETNRRNRQ